MWLSTLEIGAEQYVSLLYRNRSEGAVVVCDRTEALSDMVFVSAQKVSDLVWTSPKFLKSVVNSGAPNENIVQNHLNIVLLNVF